MLPGFNRSSIRAGKRFFLLPLFVLTTSCNHLFYFPDHILYYPPEKIGISDYQQLKFNSKDNTELSAWFFPTKSRNPAKGTILQFHGNGQNLSSHYIALVWLIDHGYNFMTFDYRGYGLSKGYPSQKGTVLDAQACLEYTLNRHLDLKVKNPQAKFIIFGESLGGAIVARALKNFKSRDQIDLLVMDSTFLSYREVASEKAYSHPILWLTAPLSWLFVSDRYSAKRYFSKYQIPLLVIHDELDPIIPFKFGEKTYRLAQSNKDFWTFRNSRHVGSFSQDLPRNREKLVDYLDKLKVRHPF